MTHGFANYHVEIGDLNSSNAERRLNEITWGGTRSEVAPRAGVPTFAVTRADAR